MQDGVFTADTLPNILRSLSQKRKSGVLEICGEGVNISVGLLNGRISSVERTDRATGDVFLDRLKQAGVVDAALVVEFDEPHSIESVFADLVSKKVVGESVLVQAARALQLDLLHSVRKAPKGSYEFVQRVIKSEPKLSLNISPGQMLLDLVQIETDDARLNALLRGNKSLGRVTALKSTQPEGLNEYERLIWNTLQTKKTLEELAARSIISNFHLKESLLALHDRKVIEVGPDTSVTSQPAKESAVTTAMSAAPVVAEKPISGSSAITPASNAPDRAGSRGEDRIRERLASQSSKVDGPDSEINRLIGMLESLPAEDPISQDTFDSLRIIPEGNERSAKPKEDLAREERKRRRAIRAERPIPRAIENTDVPPQSVSAITHFNFLLLREDVRNKVMLVLTVLYLITVAVLGSSLFERWFDALSVFTSQS